MNRSFIDEYEKSAEKLGLAVRGLERDDMLAVPVPGAWSIQRIVLHLADTEQVLADRMKRVIAEDNPPLLAFDQDKWTAALRYDEQSAQDAIALVEITRRQMGRVLRALPDEAFDRRGTHNQAGPLSLRQIVEKASSHLEHHLKFIVDKREMLGKIMW